MERGRQTGHEESAGGGEDADSLSAAHDLKNLLFLIGTRGERLRRALAPDHPERPEVDAILEATRQGVALALELLATPGRPSASADVLDLNSAVTTLEPVLASLVEGHAELATALDSSVPPARGRLSYLEQALRNLVLAARETMPPGGTVTIGTSHRLSPGPGGGLQRQAVVTVHHAGGGSAPARIHIIDPITATKPVAGGGLVLTVVQRLVAQMGGLIEIDSTPDEGTTVRIVLPAAIADAKPHQDTRAVPLASPPSGQPARIVLADDDEDILRLLRLALQDRGHQLVLASTGRDAVDQCADAPADLLVTDINLGDINGLELARQLRTRNPRMRVVFISGDPIRALPPGLEDAQVIEKPFSISQFRVIVDTTLRSYAAAR